MKQVVWFVFLCFVVVTVTVTATTTTTPYLSYWFNTSCLENPLVTTFAETSHHTNDFTTTSGICASRYLYGTTSNVTMGGISVNDCSSSPNVASVNLSAATDFFDSYNLALNLDISFEVWFSLDTVVPNGQDYTYRLMEISRHSTFTPSLDDGHTVDVSIDPADIQMDLQVSKTNEFVFAEDGIYSSGIFEIAAIQNKGGVCPKFMSVSIFPQEESANYESKLKSIGTNPHILYKYIISLHDGTPTFYLTTSDDEDSVEYSVGWSSYVFFDEAIKPARLKLFTNSMLRLGCSVDPNVVGSPGVVFYKVAVYENALSLTDVTLILQP